MHQRIRFADARDRKAPLSGKTPDRHDWARATRLACLCIAIFDGAHLVYRTTRAPAWFDVRLFIAISDEVAPSSPELNVKILALKELDLDCWKRERSEPANSRSAILV